MTNIPWKDRGFTLSPSSWNNFESCPRKFWLSRQRLPRKTGMPAAIGTAVHDTVEDLCNLDLLDRDGEETGWLPRTAKQLLRKQWEEERESFFNTPRHPAWKEDEFEKAQKLLIGALNIMFSKAGRKSVALATISVDEWRAIQEMVLAAEGTLRSTCGRLMGRLDLLIAERDESGETIGWIVADLKTGRAPEDELYDTVSRQLRLYRDLLAENNPGHPPITTEGWYALNSKVYVAEGPNVLEDAFAAWEKMRPTETPLPATPSADACAFCEWKAWCPSWIWARAHGELEVEGVFRDEVVQVVRIEDDGAVALVERMNPVDVEGNVVESGQRFGVVVRGYARESLRELLDMGWEGPMLFGSVNVGGSSWQLGDWCDVLPWKPIPDSGELPAD